MKCIVCNNDIKVNCNRCSKCGCMVASAESVYFFEWLPADKTVTRSLRKFYEITERSDSLPIQSTDVTIDPRQREERMSIISESAESDQKHIQERREAEKKRIEEDIKICRRMQLFAWIIVVALDLFSNVVPRFTSVSLPRVVEWGAALLMAGCGIFGAVCSGVAHHNEKKLK